LDERVVTGGRDAQDGAVRWRWGIIAFAAASVIINGFDRQMVAMLKPDILGDFGWDDADYGRLASMFQLGSVGTLLFAGWFLDRVGLKWGYAVGNGAWSLITLAHVAVTSFGGFLALRVALGASESIQTPAAVKAVASWFPTREASLGLGIVNAAPNVGAIVVPLAIPAIALAVGWRMSFVIVGAIGLVWVVAWLAARPPNPPATVSLRALEASDARWADLLKDRRVHGFMIAKILTDQTWWLMMFWLPDFFMRTFGLSSAEIARPTAFVYLLAMTGALSSGWLAGRIIAGGMPAAQARLRVLVGYGAFALVAPLALFAGDLWLAALLIGIVLFAHQGFSTNLLACVVDVFPARRVASVVSMGALAGNLWGAAVLEITGQVLAGGGTYLPIFMAVGSGYLVAAVVVRWLILRPVRGTVPA
jgi:ACS family hexuronate transporter-like MFS transporter